jgi:hypothetical protein
MTLNMSHDQIAQKEEEKKLCVMAVSEPNECELRGDNTRLESQGSARKSLGGRKSVVGGRRSFKFAFFHGPPSTKNHFAVGGAGARKTIGLPTTSPILLDYIPAAGTQQALTVVERQSTQEAQMPFNFIKLEGDDDMRFTDL